MEVVNEKLVNEKLALEKKCNLNINTGLRKLKVTFQIKSLLISVDWKVFF